MNSPSASQFWDDRYAAEEYVYGVDPNEFFKSFIDHHKAGSILLPADGEGRNGVYAAMRGWDVTSFDFSEKAKEKALKLAERKKVSINYLIADINNFTPEKKFDLIAMLYVHFASEYREMYHKKIINWLKPGGILLIEAFSKEQINNDSGGPRDINMLYNKKIFQNDFNGMGIIYLDEIEFVRKQGLLHDGLSNVVQLIARKSILN